MGSGQVFKIKNNQLLQELQAPKILLDFAKMTVIRSFNRLVYIRKRDLFVRGHRNIHFLILSLPILLMKFLKEILKIVSYFQFSLTTSHFEMILQESMIVEISNTSIAKNQRFLTLVF